MGNLHAANSEWAARPADERYWTIGDMRAACEAVRDGSGVITRNLSDLRFEAHGQRLAMLGQGSVPAEMSHYAFGQVAQTLGAPASYLRALPATLAADCLNTGITYHAADRTPRELLFHKNGRLTLRACLSDRYERVWDADVCRHLEALTEAGWRAPAARYVCGDKRIATEADILPGQINIAVGDAIGPAGLYASDHDMFAFLVAPDRTISDGAGGTLMRGIFVSNSEVGDKSLKFSFFSMQAVCGNHIVWGAKNVHEVNIRHIPCGVRCGNSRSR